MSLARTRLPQGLCGRDGEDAGAGADVEHFDGGAAESRGRRRCQDAATRRLAPLRQSVEGHQAAARGAVMSGAEGERGFDLDGDPRGRDAVPVMGLRG